MATSGANNTPLGRLNPALHRDQQNQKQAFQLQAQQNSLLKPSYMSGTGGMKRDYDDEYEHFLMSTNWPPELSGGVSGNSSSALSREERRKKRKSRWEGDDKEKVFIPGMPTILPGDLNQDQERAYLLQLQIEELSRRLRTGDLGIPANPEDRSPSPEPIYNSEGKRLNTREYRMRKRIEDDRHILIVEMFKINTDYKPPMDYKPPVTRVSEKVMIPQEEHPDINFVGLLIGPRGNTLKAMEKDTGAKIIIRGKGSVKEGKVGRKDGQPLPGEDEPLHAFVTANNPESVKKAVDKIRDIIRQGVEVPEGQNDLRRMQLRELALLNGTLRENEGPRCTNCGASTHRSWQCPDKPNITNNVICGNCGAAGHIARDCREKKLTPGIMGVEKSKIDEEYMSLMAELGEGPPVVPKTLHGLQAANQGPNLGNPTGIPRAIMAPPLQQAQTQITNPTVWVSTAQTKPPTLVASTQLTQHAAAPTLMVPPIGPPGVTLWQPPGQQTVVTAAQMDFRLNNEETVNRFQLSALGLQPVPPPPTLITQPPPPPPSTQVTSLPWMTQQQATVVATSPWGSQPTTSIPVGVPPPVGMPAPPPGNAPLFTWTGFMGVPPPPPMQPPLPPGLASIPPPPPPGSTPLSTSGLNTTVDMNMLAGLPNLLSAPPPPPPN